MAEPGNMFALLDGDEEASTIIEAAKVAAKAAVEKEKEKRMWEQIEMAQQHTPLHHGRNGSPRGQNENFRSNTNQRWNGNKGGYKGVDGYVSNYKGNYGDSNGYQGSYNRNNGDNNGYWRSYRGGGRYQQRYNRGPDYNSGCYEHQNVYQGGSRRVDRSNRDNNFQGNYGGEGKDYQSHNGWVYQTYQGRKGHHDGRNNGWHNRRDEVSNVSEKDLGGDAQEAIHSENKSDVAAKDNDADMTEAVTGDNGDNKSNGFDGDNVAATADGQQQDTADEQQEDTADGQQEVTQGSKKSKNKSKKKSEALDNSGKNDEKEKDYRKKMTLKEYEENLLEKRKALESLKKTQLRAITLDKDFETMQLVGKKNDDGLFIKTNSEEDKLEKKESFNKEDKNRKSMSIDEFLKQGQTSYGRRHGRRGERSFAGTDENKHKDRLGYEGERPNGARGAGPHFEGKMTNNGTRYEGDRLNIGRGVRLLNEVEMTNGGPVYKSDRRNSGCRGGPQDEERLNVGPRYEGERRNGRRGGGHHYEERTNVGPGYEGESHIGRHGGGRRYEDRPNGGPRYQSERRNGGRGGGRGYEENRPNGASKFEGERSNVGHEGEDGNLNVKDESKNPNAGDVEMPTDPAPASSSPAAFPPPYLKDPNQFPALGGVMKA